ncbi:ankyrin repeat domain-containing protein [Streptomyces misionensis]|uniref:ankyrin repeat domain-containing protein n=1 Tax=Streptomyces misionensis TaxID=67331 RepID=UPI00396BA952
MSNKRTLRTESGHPGAAEQALHRAVREGDLPGAADALYAGADPNARDPLGYPALSRAAALGRTQLTELLLTAGADPLLPDVRMGTSPLHKAAQGGCVDVVRLLLDHGAFVDAQAPTTGHTPLIDAVWYKHPPVVELLLDRGANPDVRAHAGYRADELGPLVCEEDQSVYVRLIEAARARRARAAGAALRLAALSGDATGARAALATGADADVKAPDGHTALLDASREGHPAVVAALLAHGADPTVVDHLMKATPAHKAAYMGRPEVMRELVADGRVELDAQGPYNGYTALHDAVWHGHTETVRVLLEAGVRTDLAGWDGLTPLDMARRYGYDDIVALLEKAGRAPEGA